MGLSERLSMNENTRLKKTELFHLSKQFGRAKKVVFPFCYAICCNTCFKRTNEYRLQEQMMVKYERDLDIGYLAKHLQDLKLFMNRLLTPTQKLLLKF